MVSSLATMEDQSNYLRTLNLRSQVVKPVRAQEATCLRTEGYTQTPTSLVAVGHDWQEIANENTYNTGDPGVSSNTFVC